MSVKIVNKKVYECRCELDDCPGKGQSWESKSLSIPPRCNFCHRFTWNGNDRRRVAKEKPEKIAKALKLAAITLPKPKRASRRVSQ